MSIMSKNFISNGRLSIEKGFLCYSVSCSHTYHTGSGKRKVSHRETQKVYKLYSNGLCYGRNINFIYISGYGINFKNDPRSNRYYDSKWYKLNGTFFEDKSIFSDVIYDVNNAFDVLLKYNPKSIHFINAIKKGYFDLNIPITLLFLFNLYKVWETNNTVEFLISNSCGHLCLNKSIMNYTNQRKRKLIQLIKKCSIEKPSLLNSISMKDISFAISNNCSLVLSHAVVFEGYKSFKDYFYVQSHCNGSRISYYDYLSFVDQTLHHNINDPYWRYPKDFAKACNDMIDFKAKLSAEKNALRAKAFNDVVSQFDFNKCINGYSFHIPKSYLELEKQAAVLNQCLIVCSYDKKVVKHESFLFFVSKDDVPYGTFEVNRDNKIVQFYLNEADRKNCHPSEELKSIANNIIESFYWNGDVYTQRKRAVV